MNSSNPKIKKLYYSISEVSKITGLKQYVLRYWETEFSQLKPPKNRAGNRTYRKKDIEIVHKIKDLLYKQKFTIDGARNQLNAGLKVSNFEENKDPINTSEIEPEVLKTIKQELQDILNIIND